MVGSTGYPSLVDFVATAAGSGLLGAVVGALGIYFQQRTSSKDRADNAVLAGSSAAATLATTAINQWQEIVAAQGKIQAEHVAEINRLRLRAERCEAETQAQGAEIRRLHNELRMVRVQVIEERRQDG